MIDQPVALFLMNLVQDVNILRPLVHMASAHDFHSRILVSPRFAARDLYGIWEAELGELQRETAADLHFYSSDEEAFRLLTGRGIIFAGSESSVPGHIETHNLFRYAPASFLRVTLQHGFECVGFRHSAAHDRAHSRSASFAADLLCAWQPAEMLTALAPSQRPKLVVTGPTASLQQFAETPRHQPDRVGIVCENLHSVRLGGSAAVKPEFMATFSEFCRLMDQSREQVALRPHPGGQYVLRKQVNLPPNVTIENSPLYRLDLRRFAFGISAPSSVLIDMLLAGIPTAVWRDAAGAVDTGNYDGLEIVNTPRDWFEFAKRAVTDPGHFIDLQRRFLDRERVVHDTKEVYERFSAIFRAARLVEAPPVARRVPEKRILVVANARLPTLQVCIERPLRTLINSGVLAIELLTEIRIRQRERDLGSPAAVRHWITRTLERQAPDTVIFSRYSGPHGDTIINWARHSGVPVIYQIDDDLLGVPPELGDRKHAYHNAPERLEAIRSLCGDADLVYASTDRLKERLLERMGDISLVSGRINCSNIVIKVPRSGPTLTIGYMASADHLPNLLTVLPAIIEALDRHPDLMFELFGSIPKPSELERFGDRVRTIGAVSDYDRFLDQLGDREWQVGICPLVPNTFNLCKSNNKWVEYTALGISVIASGGMIYDECCADGCGLLAHDLEEWRGAIEQLITSPELRETIATRAQRKLQSDFGVDQHRSQLLSVLDLASSRARERPVLPARQQDHEDD